MRDTSPQTATFVDRTPGFRARVERAATTRRPAVTVRLADFDDDPLRLYACLEFARSRGVRVSFSAAPAR
jgi:hypothetical protein